MMMSDPQAADPTTVPESVQDYLNTPIHTLIALLRSHIRGIAKHGQAAQAQGGYRYQSIEDILNAAGPWLALYGLTAEGTTIHHEMTHWTSEKSQRVESYTVLVRYRWRGPMGDTQKIGTYGGNAWDYAGDKAMNKAYTAARKLMWRDWLQLTTDDDVDTEAVNMPPDASTAAPPPPPPRADGIELDRIHALRAIVQSLEGTAKEKWTAFSTNFSFGVGVKDEKLSPALMAAGEQWAEHLRGGFPEPPDRFLIPSNDPHQAALDATLRQISVEMGDIPAEDQTQEPQAKAICEHHNKAGRRCIREIHEGSGHRYGPEPTEAESPVPQPQAGAEQARSAAQRLTEKAQAMAAKAGSLGV